MRLLLTAFLSFLILFSGQFQIIDIHQNTKSTIQVTVHGAVLQQGVISLRPYATLEELIAFVGLADDADISSLNLGTVLHIPKIGEKTAQAIIDYRNQYGLFKTLEDLMKVKGIGQAKFDFIKDKICL